MDTEKLLATESCFASWWHLARAYHSLAGYLGRFFEEWGITGAQFGVLRSVRDAGPEGLMLSDLSKRLMVTCGNITGVVDRLEQAGYLRRERCDGDRRVIRARLTEEGTRLFERILPAYLKFLEGLMTSVTLEEREAITRCCGKLHSELEPKSRRGGDSTGPEKPAG